MVDGKDQPLTKRQLDTNDKEPEIHQGSVTVSVDLLLGLATQKVVRMLCSLESLGLGVCLMDVCLF